MVDNYQITDLEPDRDYFVQIKYVRDGVESVPLHRILRTVEQKDDELCVRRPCKYELI